MPVGKAPGGMKEEILMKKVLGLLMVIAMIFSLTACGNKTTENDKVTEEESVVEENSNNILPGGNFEASDSHWNIYKESGGNATFAISGGKLKVKISNPGKKAHSVQIYCDGFELLQNTKYKITMTISASVNRKIEWRAQINGGDYHAYAGEEGIEIGTEKKLIETEFVMEEASDPAPRFCLNFGFDKTNPDLGEQEITVEGISMEIIDSSAAVEVEDNTGEVAINLNQLGYLPDDVKKAVFREAGKDDKFDIIDANTREVVFSGTVSGEYKAEAAGETVSYADFSEFKTPGTYRIKADNSGESYLFTIGTDVYSNAFRDIVKMLYLQRCGSELTKECAGDFAHAACHTQIATIYGTDKKIDVSGGWHDAGDYGRYVVPASKTVADLINAYEMNPSVFTDDFGIPESGNGVPDILDEARYEIEWMLKMQDSETGGVYHKVTGLQFEGQIPADEDTTELYVMPISNWDTADFAATMAIASRTYMKYDKEFSDKCLEAARKACEYHIAHRGERGFLNPEDVSTGEYPDGISQDEYIWMITELYKTTGEKEYHELIKDFDMEKLVDDGLGWANVDLYAVYAYLTAENTDEAMVNKFKDRFKAVVDDIYEKVEKDAYGSSLGMEYPWGSNMSIANNGIIFLWAEKFLGDRDYRALAKKQLDYIFGNNALSYSFVTGIGEHSPLNPHHRPSMALGTTMKGMLVGGPDSNLEDPYARKVLTNVPAAKCYRDNSQSYSCNEITIYWNSPLICLMSSFLNN